jgi:hypothetical protein
MDALAIPTQTRIMGFCFFSRPKNFGLKESLETAFTDAGPRIAAAELKSPAYKFENGALRCACFLGELQSPDVVATRQLNFRFRFGTALFALRLFRARPKIMFDSTGLGSIL